MKSVPAPSVYVARPGLLLLALCAVWNLSSPARADVIDAFDATGTFQGGQSLGGTLTVDTTTGTISSADLTVTGQPDFYYVNNQYAISPSTQLLQLTSPANDAVPGLQSPSLSLLLPSSLVGYGGGSILPQANGTTPGLNIPIQYNSGVSTLTQPGPGSLTIGSLSLAGSACSADLKNSVTLAVAPDSTRNAVLDNNNAMTASFTPNGVNLQQAASDCHVDGFDWKQTVDLLPMPSPGKYRDGSALPSSFDDPPQGGYNYIDKCSQTHLENNFPFYYSATGPSSNCANVAAHTTNGTTLNFIDVPADPCLPGLVFGNALATRLMACPDLQAPPGSEITFTTSLVGVADNANGSFSPVSLDSMLQGVACIANGPSSSSGCTWTWESDYNGTYGGVATLQTLSLNPEDADDNGTGNVQILIVGGVNVSVVEPSSILLMITSIAVFWLCWKKVKPVENKY